MATYNTFNAGEKASLLGADSARPYVVEHYHSSTCYRCDLELNGRKRRVGCCRRICQLFMFMFLGVFALFFLLRHLNPHWRLPSLRSFSSGVDVPVAVAQCPSAPVSYKAGELKYSFDMGTDDIAQSFFFGQRWSQKPKVGPSSRFVQTAGRVIVKAAPFGASEPITVDLDVNLSHEELADIIVIDRESSGLVFKSQAFLESFEGADPCVSVVATISVSPSANISSFDIDTVVLPVELRDSLRLTSENMFIHSTSGSISSDRAGLNSRRIQVETTSNTISGNFPLLDLLSIKTVSGAVNVEIQPQNDVEKRPGDLMIRTASGDIQAETLTSSIPNRNFSIQVNTVSGSVSGTFLLGVAANVNSGSGSIDADFYTAGDAANRTCILNSVTGSVRAAVHDQFYEIGSVRSNVQSRAGRVDVQFPAAWEGHVQGLTRTGAITITGDGVNIVKDVSRAPGLGRIVVAEKGDGYSNLSTETITGSIAVSFA